jgi:hypothetical protein
MWVHFDSHRRTGVEENSNTHDDFQLASWTDSGLEKVHEIARNCDVHYAVTPASLHRDAYAV